MDPFDLDGIAQHDQNLAALTDRAKEIAAFYRALIEGGLPPRLAGRIVQEWTAASFEAAANQPALEPYPDES